MTSLREKLNDQIRMNGYWSYAEMVKFVMEEGFKVSNAERRLRHSESPNIRPVMATSKRGTSYIQGYEWVGERVSAPQKVESVQIQLI